MLEVAENPFVSITKHYDNLGLNYREANVLKKELISKGWLKEDQIVEGWTRKKILSLTEKGRSYLMRKGWPLQERKSNAGPEHEYWKSKIKEKVLHYCDSVEEEVALEDENEKEGD